MRKKICGTWDEGKEIFLCTLSDQIGNVPWEKSLFLSTVITFDTWKAQQRHKEFPTWRIDSESLWGHVQSTGGTAGQLWCLSSHVYWCSCKLRQGLGTRIITPFLYPIKYTVKWWEMGIAELHQAGPSKRSALFRESFYSAQSNSLLAVKKNWEASKACVSQISKKWKTRFQEEKCENRSSGRASCVSHTGDRWGRDQPRTFAASPGCLPRNWC